MLGTRIGDGTGTIPPALSYYDEPSPPIRPTLGGGAGHRDPLLPPRAVETFSSFGVGILCIALGIMALAAFFRALNWLGNRGGQPGTIAIRGVLKKGTWATVYMSGAETFPQVRFLGFTQTESVKNQLPYELNGMVILEDRDGRRFLIRAKAIRMIVIDPEAPDSQAR